MTMTNWIADVILLIVAAFIIWRCTANGFVRGLLRFARTFIAILLAYLLGSTVGAYFYDSFIKEPVYESVYEKVDSLREGAEAELTSAELAEKFPDFLMTPELQQKLESLDQGAENWVASVSETIATPLATVISNVIAYVLVFIVAFILLSIVIWILNGLVDKIKILGLVNHLLGFVWGALLAICLCFAVSSIMRVLLGSSELYTQSTVIRFFGESSVLKFLGFLDIGETFLSSAG